MMYGMNDISEYLNISRTTLYRYLNAGEFPKPTQSDPNKWDELAFSLIKVGWAKNYLDFPENEAVIISIFNQKGGVGKTMTATNLAASLSIIKKRVLLIDIDPQANSSLNLGISVDKNIHHVFLDGLDPLDVIVKLNFPGPLYLDLLPSDIQLSLGKESMTAHPLRMDFLSSVVGRIKNLYDFIIIDCPPDLGTLSLNALKASHGFIIPMNAEANSLKGLSDLLRTVRIVQGPSYEMGLNHPLNLIGILITDKFNTLVQNAYEEVIRSLCANKVFTTAIPHLTAFEQAKALQMPIISHEPGGKAAQSYLSVVAEMMKIIKKNRKDSNGQ